MAFICPNVRVILWRERRCYVGSYMVRKKHNLAQVMGKHIAIIGEEKRRGKRRSLKGESGGQQ